MFEAVNTFQHARSRQILDTVDLLLAIWSDPLTSSHIYALTGRKFEMPAWKNNYLPHYLKDALSA